MHFALNHKAVPKRSIGEFFALSKALGISEVEIRNDLPDTISELSTDAVREAADRAGVTILTINALQAFNVWTEERSAQLQLLADYAYDCGAKALVLCPLNNGTNVSFDDTVMALEQIRPILKSRSLTGLVEPLGFPASSLRMKATAIDAIEAASGSDEFKLVHDTFHHHLAGESELYPKWSALVHISGVTDESIAVENMLDKHRVLVDKADRLGNVAQIQALIAAGYDGPFSFEPFAPDIHDLVDPQIAIRESMNHISSHV